MQIRTNLKGGPATITLLQVELRILRAGEELRSRIIREIGEEKGKEFIAASIKAYSDAEAAKIADEARKAGAEEEARPILAAVEAVETNPQPTEAPSEPTDEKAASRKGRKAG